MKSRNFGLIGYPLSHSMSPFIHKRLFELSGLPGTYTNFETAPEILKERINDLKLLNGFNVTIPHKVAVIPFLDELESKAALFGAVNTVNCRKTLKGYNTDCDGFLRALQSSNINLQGKVLILGSGGASRMFAFEAALAGCDITICARAEDKIEVEALKNDMLTKIKNAKIELTTQNQLSGRYDLLINGTPVGMYPKSVGILPINETIINNSAAVFDAVYNPEDTALLKLASSNGSKTAKGMRMLVWQAVVAHEIWDNVSYINDDIEALIEDTNHELKRIFELRK